MKSVLIPIMLIFFVISCSTKQVKVCVLETNYGNMVFRFFDLDAPNTCSRFQTLVNEGFYDGKDFYRVVKDHVIQAGGGGEKLKAEFNTNPHLKGTVGIARGNDPDSGDSSFYICLAPRPHLDEQYTVFGQLVEGTEVLETIGNVEVEERFSGQVAFHRPVKPVTIKKASIEMRAIEEK